MILSIHVENYMRKIRAKLQSYLHEQNKFVARCDKNTRNDVSKRFFGCSKCVSPYSMNLTGMFAVLQGHEPF